MVQFCSSCSVDTCQRGHWPICGFTRPHAATAHASVSFRHPRVCRLFGWYWPLTKLLHNLFLMYYSTNGSALCLEVTISHWWRFVVCFLYLEAFRTTWLIWIGLVFNICDVLYVLCCVIKVNKTVKWKWNNYSMFEFRHHSYTLVCLRSHNSYWTLGQTPECGAQFPVNKTVW